MWGTNTGFTSFAYTPQGYPLHRVTAAAADAAAPLILDRLKQADRRQAAYIPIPAINAPIQAEKRREYRQDRHREGSAADRQQTEGKPETLPNMKTGCTGCFLCRTADRCSADIGCRQKHNRRTADAETDRSPAADRLLSNAEQLPGLTARVLWYRYALPGYCFR